MIDGRSFYEILGVARSATAPDIRSAYLKLMKRHHPDSRRSGLESDDFVAVLNIAYGTLKDRAKRAQYDAALSRSTDWTGPQQCLPRNRGHGQKRKRDEALVTAIAALAVIGVPIAVLELARPIPVPRSIVSEEVLEGGEFNKLPPEVRGHALVATGETDTIMLARTSSIAQAEDFSRRCFAVATGANRTSAAEPCIAFDVAFQYWTTSLHPVNLRHPYFADHVLVARHRQALSDLGAAADVRLAGIRQRAFDALIRTIDQERADLLASSVTDGGPVAAGSAAKAAGLDATPVPK